MNKIKDLEFIRNYCQNNELTAYKIAKETGLSSVGIQNIISGTTENPRKETVKIIKDYINNIQNEDEKANIFALEPELVYKVSKNYDSKVYQIEEEIFARENIISNSIDTELIKHHRKIIALLKSSIEEIEKAKNNHITGN